jgi:hypothetical protein
MTTRSAALITIALIAVLLAVVAMAAVFAGDISERAGGIVTTVLGTFATVLTGLLVVVRLETVNSKADVAAEKAEVAAEKAGAVADKVDQVHQDVLNGPMRQNVKEALRESEDTLVETVAKGVRQDRHSLASREQAAYARGVADARQRQWRMPPSDEGAAEDESP